MVALSNSKILEEIDKGDIVISPFEELSLNTSSYDVRLGEYYFREQHNKHNHNIFNVYQESDICKVWGHEPNQAKKASDTFKDYNLELDGIDPNDSVILLQPGETILAHTQEFIGGRNHITTMMKARSSLGRCFLEVCKCAGWGDVGYINRWTMEITNNSQHYVIPLVVGRRVAQIVFFETGPTLDTDYSDTGKYQSSKDLRKLIRDWKPEDMLPKTWKDRDIKCKKR